MTVSALKKWIESRARHSRCQVQQIPLLLSQEWNYDRDIIEHFSGRFFKLTGIEWSESGKLYNQLIIDQSEIGLLGFVLWQGRAHNYLLAQAKVEPGNTGLAQIAPTCQATLSNLDQAHGGTRPLWAELFKNASAIISSCRQSEQGSRFLGKRNTNSLIISEQKFPVPAGYKWVDTRLLCQAMTADYLVNTDARSVLVTADWTRIIKGKIFNHPDKFSQELQSSFFADKQIISNEEIIAELNRRAKLAPPVKRVPWNKLKSYSQGEKAISADDPDSFRLIQIKVQTRDREVKSWDQPIIQSYRRNYFGIYCARNQGDLYFGFTFWQEPGLYNRVELGPHRLLPPIGDKIITSCWQSDEGGRFFQDQSRYYLLDKGKVSFDTEVVWLNLRQVQELSLLDGIFCNEARSAISLILAFV